MGVPVKNAMTKVKFKKKGIYHVWARTKNWVPGEWKAPGRFKIAINGTELPKVLGTIPGWNWVYVDEVEIRTSETQIELVDLTGFNARCDAIYFNKSKTAPPSSEEELLTWRKDKLNKTLPPEKELTFDLVITGGGIAGCAAAIAAAEQGLKVALIHDRPVLGGNAVVKFVYTQKAFMESMDVF